MGQGPATSENEATPRTCHVSKRGNAEDLLRVVLDNPVKVPFHQSSKSPHSVQVRTRVLQSTLPPVLKTLPHPRQTLQFSTQCSSRRHNSTINPPSSRTIPRSLPLNRIRRVARAVEQRTRSTQTNARIRHPDNSTESSSNHVGALN